MQPTSILSQTLLALRFQGWCIKCQDHLRIPISVVVIFIAQYVEGAHSKGTHTSVWVTLLPHRVFSYIHDTNTRLFSSLLGKEITMGLGFVFSSECG